jgi:hypothetical protein
MKSLDFWTDTVLPAALRPRGRPSPQHKRVPRIFPKAKDGRRARLTSQPSVGQLSTKRGSLFMPLVILHHLLNVSVQLANKRGFKKNRPRSNYPYNICWTVIVTNYYAIYRPVFFCLLCSGYFSSVRDQAMVRLFVFFLSTLRQMLE